MKNYLSIGVIALLFALTFGTVKSVQAIAGYGWLPDRPPINNSQLVVSMAGIVEGTDKKVFINFFEIDLTTTCSRRKDRAGLKSKIKTICYR